jgi:hypothetical protein
VTTRRDVRNVEAIARAAVGDRVHESMKIFLTTHAVDYTSMLMVGQEAAGAAAMMFMSIARTLDTSALPEDVKVEAIHLARRRIVAALTVAQQLVESANPQILADAMGLETESVIVPNPHYREPSPHR